MKINSIIEEALNFQKSEVQKYDSRRQDVFLYKFVEASSGYITQSGCGHLISSFIWTFFLFKSLQATFLYTDFFFFFQSNFKLTAKFSRRYKDFTSIPYPHPCTTSLTIHIPHPGGTLVIINL